MSSIVLKKRDSNDYAADGSLETTTLAFTFDQPVAQAINSPPAIVIPDWSLAAKTTIPTLIVTDFILGTTPTSTKLQSLADFSLLQYNAYAAAGVGDPSIGPYEALGLGLSKTSEFAAKFGSGTDQSFIATTYHDIFGREAGDAQLAHFQSQLDYFKNLYLGAGVDPESSTIGARGAVVGQMLGFAAAEPENAYFQSSRMYLLDTANGSPVQPVALRTAYDLNESGSQGQVTVASSLLGAFVPVGSVIDFKIDGAFFSRAGADYKVVVNGTALTNPAIAFSQDGSHLFLNGILNSGQNVISLIGFDDAGNPLEAAADIWAGTSVSIVRILDRNGVPVVGAAVVASLTESPDVFATAISDQSGFVAFTNLPNRNITIEAVQGSLFGSLGIVGGDSSTVIVSSLAAPSPIQNDDFSLGFDGWSVNGAPVSLEDHQESNAAAATFGSTSTSLDARLSSFTSYSFDLEPEAAISAAASTNKDLVLRTSGEGPQTISRTFTAQGDTQVVTLRYKFITSEFPKYFGDIYNDYYTVTLRDSAGNRISVTASMNGLGRSAFDATGATAWSEVSLVVGKNAVVQAEVTVANVGDGLFDSKLVLDFVNQGKLWIKNLDLNDIDNQDLHFLSVSSVNPFFSGHTRVNGSITIVGEETDSIKTITLEILYGGNVVAHADLSAAAQKLLLNQAFGADKEVSIKASSLLFELSNAQAALIPVSIDGSVDLRVAVTTASNQTVRADYGSVDILTLYTGQNRYPEKARDAEQGGDGWALPSTIDLLKHFAGLMLVGDVSNMNGGKFSPHSSHQTGQDIDGWYTGYNNHDAAAAATMLYFLNDPAYGSQIFRVLVDFEKTATDPFWNAIKDVTLADGRPAATVIFPDADHDTHFHWRLLA